MTSYANTKDLAQIITRKHIDAAKRRIDALRGKEIKLVFDIRTQEDLSVFAKFLRNITLEIVTKYSRNRIADATRWQDDGGANTE
jgi:hypothetical protein